MGKKGGEQAHPGTTDRIATSTQILYPAPSPPLTCFTDGMLWAAANPYVAYPAAGATAVMLLPCK